MAHANRHTFPRWDGLPKCVSRMTEMNAQGPGNGEANHRAVLWMNFHTAAENDVLENKAE